MVMHRDGRLPPLDLLTAFEAAARHGSFTRAAEELGVTQSAVSQRIRQLEENMGAALFDRRNRAVSLTQAGRDLRNGVVVAFGHLASASSAARRGQARAHVSLATDQSVAEMCLQPRLSELRALHPDMSLTLYVSDNAEECLAANADLTILHGGGDWAGYRCTLMFEDEIFPVAAPGVDLADARLLDLDYQHWNWMNWSIWSTETGLYMQDREVALRCNSYPRLIEAARQGTGIALGWGAFVEGDLASGRLVRPVPLTVRPGLGYYLLEPFNVAAGPASDAIRDWLVDKLKV